MPQEFHLVNDVDGATHVGPSQPRSFISSLLPLCNITLILILAVAVIATLVRMDQRCSQQADEIKIMRDQIKYFEAMHSLSGAQIENKTGEMVINSPINLFSSIKFIIKT